MSARPRVRRQKLVTAVSDWLAGLELAGADLVRAQLALALAAEVDDVGAPRYARPRIAAELRATLAELEDREPDDGRVAVERLLAAVMS